MCIDDDGYRSVLQYCLSSSVRYELGRCLAFKSLVPIIMAGILSIYGLIIAVLLSQKVKIADDYGAYNGFKQMAAGLTCGFSCVASGYAIGVVGEVAVKMYGINENIFVAIILIMIFAEVLGLYGMIVSIIMSV